MRSLSLSRARARTHTHTHTEGKFMSIKEVMPQVNVTTLLCLKQGKKQKKKKTETFKVQAKDLTL